MNWSENDTNDFTIDIENKYKENSMTRVFKKSIYTTLSMDGLFD